MGWRDRINQILGRSPEPDPARAAADPQELREQIEETEREVRRLWAEYDQSPGGRERADYERALYHHQALMQDYMAGAEAAGEQVARPDDPSTWVWGDPPRAFPELAHEAEQMLAGHYPGTAAAEREEDARLAAELGDRANAYRNYQERRQPADDRERELYEGFAADDETAWWHGHHDAVAEISQCSDYYRADEIQAQQPPDFTSWFSTPRDAQAAADVEPGEKPGDPKGAHGAPVVSGPVPEHPADPLNPRSDLVPSTGWDPEPAVEVTTGPGGSSREGQRGQREPDGPEGGLAGPATGPELDQLIEEFANQYPEISVPEMQQAEIDKDAAENWDGAVYPPYEGPGYTEPPADWEGWHQPHSEHEREHYWDTPEHDIPPEPQPAGYEPIPEAEPF